VRVGVNTAYPPSPRPSPLVGEGGNWDYFLSNLFAFVCSSVNPCL
jgi:hypothetical protein